MSITPKDFSAYIYGKIEYGIVILDPKVVYSNASAKAIFGFDPIGKGLSELFGNDYMLVLEPEATNHEYQFEHMIGEEWYNITAAHMENATVVIIKREYEDLTGNPEILIENADLFSSIRSSASVISLLAESLLKSSPEGSEYALQILHCCYQISRDIGLISALTTEYRDKTYTCIKALLSHIYQESEPLLREIGIRLEYTKPAFSWPVYVKLFSADAEKLIYCLLTVCAYLAGTEDGENAIKLSLKAKDNSALLKLSFLCNPASPKYAFISSLSYDSNIPGRPILYRKNFDFIKKISNKYDVKVILGRDEGGKCSLLANFPIADTDGEAVLNQYEDKYVYRANMTAALIGLSDLLPISAYNKFI